MLEKVISVTNLNGSGTVFFKSTMLLGYGDDIDIVDLYNRAVGAAFSRLQKKRKRLVLW